MSERTDRNEIDPGIRHLPDILQGDTAAGFELDAHTGQGEAQTEYGSPFEAKNDGRAATIKGKVGIGSQVTLNTDRGGLTLKKN